MPNWHVAVRGNVLHLVHSQADDELDRPGAWDIVLWRGASSWDSHPELEHAALGVMLPALHKSYVRHAWVFDIPDWYLGKKNTGDEREWMVLRGGSWTIVLRFPRFAPAAVFAAVAAGFHAQLGVTPISPVLAAAISTAKTEGEKVFLSHLDDGAGGVKPPPAPFKTRPLTNAARAAL
jgi:hypothetical protein